jgi:hypothetical protein
VAKSRYAGLRHLRPRWQAAGYSDAAFARLLGFHRGHWSRLVNGHAPVAYRTGEAIYGTLARLEASHPRKEGGPPGTGSTTLAPWSVGCRPGAERHP